MPLDRYRHGQSPDRRREHFYPALHDRRKRHPEKFERPRPTTKVIQTPKPSPRPPVRKPQPSSPNRYDVPRQQSSAPVLLTGRSIPKSAVPGTSTAKTVPPALGQVSSFRLRSSVNAPANQADSARTPAQSALGPGTSHRQPGWKNGANRTRPSQISNVRVVKIFIRRRPRIFILFLVLLAIIFIAAILATVLVFVLKRTPPKPATTPGPLPRPQTFYDAVCAKDPSVKGLKKECVVGAAPSLESCKASGYCKILEYAVQVDKDNATMFVDRSRVFPATPNTANVLCHAGKNQLGQCSKDGQCLRGGNETDDDPTWYAEGVWEDSCDVPNPCWTEMGHPALQPPRGLGRDICAIYSESPTPVLLPDSCDAGLWPQHLRCKVGNNRTATAACKGLPVKLWICTGGPRGMSKAGSLLCRHTGDVIKTEGCKYICGDVGVPNRQLPNGCRCKHPDPTAGNDTFCFSGTCLSATRRAGAEVMSKGECKQKN